MRRALIALLLLACLGVTVILVQREQGPSASKRIGVVYLVEHPAINAGLEGFRTTLDELSKDRHVSFRATYVNAFGDTKTVAEAIAAFKNRLVDAVVAFTTPCAQIARQLVHDRPVVFVGVSDPVAAGLVDSLTNGKANLVGTTSRPPYLAILRLAKAAFPDLRRIGIVYSAQEANSASAISSLQASLPTALPSLELVPRAVVNTADISPAASSLARTTDAMFVLDDNLTVSAVEVIVRACATNQIPVFACDADSVRRGALFALAIDYRLEGVAAAQLVADLLIDKKRPDQLAIAVNEATSLCANGRLFTDFPKVDRHLFDKAELVR